MPPSSAVAPKADGSTLPSRPDTLAKAHQAHSSIRAQSAKQKQKQRQTEKRQHSVDCSAVSETAIPSEVGRKQGQKGPAAQKLGGKAQGKQKEVSGNAGNPTANRDITKVVLASPLTPRW
jgi:hypothetical protein